MPQINILPKEVYQLIAAGEVVERPSSVVKEMIENSVDAGAKNITVEIKNGGSTYIRITDDGCGIARSEVKKFLSLTQPPRLRSATIWTKSEHSALEARQWLLLLPLPRFSSSPEHLMRKSAQGTKLQAVRNLIFRTPAVLWAQRLLLRIFSSTLRRE